MAEADAFPPQNTNPTPSSAEAAVAAVTAVMQKQAADERANVEASEVVDPGQKRDTPLETGDKERKPALIEGASTKEEIPDSLLDRALAVGLETDEAEGMSASTLRKLVVKLERQERPAPRTEQTAEPAEEDEEFTLPELKLSDDSEYVLDDEFKKGISARDQEILKLRKEQAETRRILEENRQGELRRQLQAEEKQFETWIADHPDLHDELGEGKGPPTSQKQLKTCQRLWARAAAIVRSEGASIPDAMEEAAAGMFRDKAKAAAIKETARKADVSAKQFTRRPAGSKTAEKPYGKERAVEALTEAMAGRNSR